MWQSKLWNSIVDNLTLPYHDAIYIYSVIRSNSDDVLWGPFAEHPFLGPGPPNWGLWNTRPQGFPAWHVFKLLTSR